jgi:hypothetical protein
MTEKLESYTCHYCGNLTKEPYIQNYGEMKMCVFCVISKLREIIYNYELLLKECESKIEKKDMN